LAIVTNCSSWRPNQRNSSFCTAVPVTGSALQLSFFVPSVQQVLCAIGAVHVMPPSDEARGTAA